jgi:fibronectin-binding autotransporter adhesin
MAALLAVYAPAHAADRYWDPNGTTPGYGGAGTWNLTSSFWSPNTDGVSGPYTAWSNSTLNNAIFGSTAGTVTLGGPITVSGLTFNTTGYVLTGNTLTLAGAAPTVTVNAGTATINSVIAGSSGLIKAGGGTLTLTGTGINTFTGDINLNAGALNAGSDAALGAASNNIFSAAGASVTLAITGANTNRTVTIGDGGVLFLAGSGAGSALITGNGRVSVGNGVTLSNDASTYTGSTTFSGITGVGNSYFTSIANLGQASSLGAPTTVTDGTIVFNQSSQYSDNVIYLGDGDSSDRNWQLNGSAALIRNRGTGTLSITGNINTSGASGFYAEDADIDLLGVLSGGNYSFTALAGHAVTLGSANTFTGTAAVGGLVNASVLDDIGSASSFGAGTNISLSVGTVSYTGTGANSDRVWTGNGASGILNDGSGALALSGGFAFSPVAPNPDSLTLGGSFTGTSTYSGIISGTGNLISDGAGTWVLGGANTFAGSITVNNGTLQAGNASAFGAATGFTVNGGTLDLGGFDLVAPSLQGTGGAIALGANTLTVDTTQTTSYAGAISGTGGLAKAGVGTFTLSGANTYTGDTTLGGGGLTLDYSASGAPATNIIAAGSALNMAGGKLDIIGADGAANNQSFNGLNVTAGSNEIAASSGAGGSMTVDFGAITRTGGLVDFALPASGNFMTRSTSLGGWATVNGTDYAKVVADVITAFTPADYTKEDDASTWLTGDVVSDVGGDAGTPFFNTINGSQQLGGLKYTAAAASTVNIGAGKTLGINGTIIVASSVGASNQIISGGSLTGGTGGGTLGILQNGAGNFTIASTIVDNGPGTGFTKGGSGLVTLTGANSYTGPTTLSGGTLAFNTIANGGLASGIGASTADAANLVLESGTLRYTGVTGTTDRGFTLVNGGPSRTIQVDSSSANLTFTGQVTSPDDAGFTKAGAGTLTLANATNDYVGVTTVAGGTLSVNTLANGRADSGIGAASSDAANLVMRDGGQLQYTGGTASTDRGFTLAAGIGRIDVAEAETTLTIGGTVAGPGSFAKEGDGVLILSGANTYTGDTTINGGVLRAGSALAFGPGDRFMTVNGSGTLDLGGYDIHFRAVNGTGAIDLGANTLTTGGGTGTFSGVITGSGGFTRAAGGLTQVLSGCNSNYTGATRIITGVLSVDCIANGGQASAIGASTADAANLVMRDDGILTYTGLDQTTDRGFLLENKWGYVDVSNAATTLEFTGAVEGPGNLAKRGSGTLVLSGANTFAGAVQVQAGTLRAGSSDAFDQGTSYLQFLDVAGALFDLNDHNASFSYLLDGGATGGDIDLGSGTLTITAGYSSASAAFGGAITGAGNLIMNGSGNQWLSGCDSDYTGTTTINDGALAVSCLNDGGVNSSIGTSTADASNLIINGGTLSYVGAGGSTNRQFTLGASGGNALDASGTGAINFTSNAPLTFSGTDTAQTLTLTGTSVDDNTLAADITNNGTGVTSLTKTGAGTWILTNPDSRYTGKTVISGGVLGVGKLADGGLASSLGASSADAANLAIGNNSTLRYTGTGDTTNRLFTLSAGTTTIQSSGTGAVVFTDTGPVTLASNNQARTIALGGTNTGNNTLAGSIGNAGTGVTTFAKNDGGTWMLTGNSTYTGPTVINDGNLIVGNGGTTGNVGTGNVIVDAATSTLSLNRSDTFTFDGTLSGPGTLAQIGAGTSILTSSTNAIGATTIGAGILQVDGGLATQTIAMTGASTLTVNGMVQAPGAAAVAITGDAGANSINVNAAATLLANGDLGAGADIVALSGTLDTGAGALALGDDNDTLVLNDGAQITGSVLAGAGTDLLRVNNALAYNLDGASVGGFERLDKQNTGTLTLTGDHTYTDGTTIEAGIVQVGSGGTSGSLASDVLNNGTLAFNRSDAYAFTGEISGTGAVNQIGAGTTTLSGDNSYSGPTSVQAGTLLVNGDQSAAAGETTVASGATLGGTGTVGGNVSVAGGAALSPGTSDGAAGKLNINGNLALNDTSNLAFNFGEPNVVGGALNDLVNVGGDLVLDGNLNVTQTTDGTFGPGIYRVISYQGALTNNDVKLSSTDYVLQTAVDHQVNLVNTAGQNLNFWDGSTGLQNDSNVNGGDGTWSLSAEALWTTDTGEINAPYANGVFAIFTGAPGAVNIDNTDGQVQASGMQFEVDGYSITGDGLTLVGGSDDPTSSIIRVGDGTTEGADMTATIGADLAGMTTLVKTDLGTLVLSGTNTYTGGTRIEDGTVSVDRDTNLGDADGAIAINGGTLQNTAAFASTRGVTLEDKGGTFLTDADLALSGVIDGAGALSKSGTGTLTLSGSNTYAGGTHINGGTLSVSSDANLGAPAGTITSDGGTLQNTAAFASARAVTLEAGGGTFQTDAALTLSDAVDGAGALTKTGAEMLALTGENTYAGGTTISDGALQLGDGGASGSVIGDVANEGALAFNRSDTYTFDGQISGSGAVNQVGGGTTILTSNNTYAGQTTVQSGALLINGDQSGATGLTSVSSGGTLGGTGIVGGDVDVADGGAIRPGGLGATPGTLAINGGLALADTSQLNYNFGSAGVVGGAFNDLVTVGGKLTLDGVLNVTQSAGGEFGPGLYRIISYDGALENNGLALGAMPAGDFRVQTSVANQVNLVNATGLALNFWDGPAGGLNDGNIHGGDGEWSLASPELWTTDTGAVNAPYANGAFAIFTGEPGTVTINNGSGAVQALGMQFATDGYTIVGDELTLVGDTTNVSTIRVGDGTLAGADMTATIDAPLSGNSTLQKTDLGTLVLGGVNTYTGGTAIKGGTLQVSQDGNLGEATGALAIDDSSLHTTASFQSGRDVGLTGTATILTDDATKLTLNGALAGSGGLTKMGTGNLVLGGTSSYTGATVVAQGTLRAGAANAFSAASDTTIAAGATLDLAGHSQETGSLDNSGVVALSGAAAGTTLTVHGNYIGHDGVLQMSSVLGTDASASDRLIIDGGTASGHTAIQLANLGGLGALTTGDGVELVGAINGATTTVHTTADAFALAGGHVDAGAFEYRLYAGDASGAGENWYLRSTTDTPPGGGDTPPPNGGGDGNGNGDGPGNGGGVVTYRPEVALYSALPDVLRQADLSMLSNLHKRQGDESQRDNADGRRAWARLVSENLQTRQSGTVAPSTDGSLQGLQAGLDLLQTSEFRAGVYAGHLRGTSQTDGFVSGVEQSRAGDLDVRNTYGGAYGTYMSHSGWYADAVFQYGWYDGRVDVHSGQRDDAGGTGMQGSLELGKNYPLSTHWSVEPQAQIIVDHMNLDGQTISGASVGMPSGTTATSRLGIRFKGAYATEHGQLQPYARFNIWHGSAGSDNVMFAGPAGSTDVVAEHGYTSGEVAVGTTWTVNPRFSVYGELGHVVSMNKVIGEQVKSNLTGSAGIRVNW